MEIERKYLITELPESLEQFQSLYIEQAYLCTEPVVRIRRQDDSYILTYKSKGLMVREEYNLPLAADSYQHLLKKADGNIIRKRRYLIPFGQYKIELDVFEAPFDDLIMAEVEFESEEKAQSFEPPVWFGEEVTFLPEYQNCYLSRKSI